MTKKMIDEKFKAVCKYCDIKLAAGPNSGTKHIRIHVVLSNEKTAKIPSSFPKDVKC
jgi:hypothetical protein